MKFWNKKKTQLNNKKFTSNLHTTNILFDIINDKSCEHNQERGAYLLDLTYKQKFKEI